jgi:hypothetical protein
MLQGKLVDMQSQLTHWHNAIEQYQQNIVKAQANLNAAEGAIQVYQHLISQIENGVAQDAAPCEDEEESNETK